MVAAWALTALLTMGIDPSLGSDSWTNPYADPVKGDKTPMTVGEIGSTIKGVKAEIQLVPWLIRIVRAPITVTVQNPTPDYLRWVRVEVSAVDEAKIARDLLTSVVIGVIKPQETVTKRDEGIWLKLTPDQIGKVHYKMKAQVVGAYRLKPEVKPRS